MRSYIDIDPSKLLREEQAMAQIDLILKKPGAEQTLNDFYEKFQNEKGEEVFFGMRLDGLVVAFRRGANEDYFSDGHYLAWALDAKLPASEIKTKTIMAKLSGDDIAVAHGIELILGFPGRNSLIELARKTEEQILSDTGISDNERSKALFLKKTGGFKVFDTKNNTHHLPQVKPNLSVTVGANPLYPLNFSRKTS